MRVPRKLRKAEVWCCTLDGSLHLTKEAGQRRVKEIEARKNVRRTRRIKRASPRRARSGPSYVDLVLAAVKDGAKSGREIRERTDMPPGLVHPTIYNLVKRSLLDRTASGLSLAPPGREKLRATEALP